MPNGKGTLDCSYCVHFDGKGYPDGCHEERLCRYHNTVLPKPKLPYHNRICCHFEPNEMYWEHNPLREFIPLLRRFAWFGADLEPGVLYEFSYNHPPGISPLAVLRVLITRIIDGRGRVNDWSKLRVRSQFWTCGKI